MQVGSSVPLTGSFVPPKPKAKAKCVVKKVVKKVKGKKKTIKECVVPKHAKKKKHG